MASSLDMSLDDIIKNNKKSGPGNPSSSRARGRGSGPGPARRPQNRAANRVAPYSTAKAPEATWQHNMFMDPSAGIMGFPGQASQPSAIETGTKLYISNLDYGVSNEDVKELFTEVGDLKRYSIHYDRSGRSKGTAEVVFSRRVDAVAAIKRYNNVQLDGKPMKIEIVGTNIATPAAAAAALGPVPAPIGAFGNTNGFPRGGLGRGGAIGRPRGGSGGGSRGRRFGRGNGTGSGGRGRGRGGRGEKVSADDLDADLDKYHTEAMQTN